MNMKMTRAELNDFLSNIEIVEGPKTLSKWKLYDVAPNKTDMRCPNCNMSYYFTDSVEVVYNRLKLQGRFAAHRYCGNCGRRNIIMEDEHNAIF